MKKCQKCEKKFDSDQMTFCSFCGSELQSINPDPAADDADDQDLDFVVIESNGAKPEFVGGGESFSADDKLEVEPPSTSSHENVIQPDHSYRKQDPTNSEDYTPIGESAPIMPGAYHDDDRDEPPDHNRTVRNQVQPDHEEQKAIKKLSDEEIKSINKQLYGSASYLTSSEKGELIDKISSVNKNVDFPGSGKSVKPELPEEPKPEELNKPHMAPQSKGVASFYKNYVEFHGIKNMHVGDEIEYEGRNYQLNPKRFSSPMVWGIGSGLFIILVFFIGSLFVSDSVRTDGQIVGVVLNQQNNPYIHGAEIRLIETGEKAKSDAQGFFTFSNLESGSYSIECYIDGKAVNREVATVSSGLTTTISIEPGELANEEPQPAVSKPSAEVVEPEPVTNQPVYSPPPVIEKTETRQLATKTTAEKNAGTTGPGKVVLAANVDNAKLILDGRTLGAGNLTYSEISPGNHSYTVSAEGYQQAAGTFRLGPGEKKTLKISLTPMTTQAKAKSFDADDYYHSGLTAHKTEKYQAAVKDFTKAIEMQPSYAAAYFYRGEANDALGEKNAAHDDYVRAGDQFQFRKDFSDAVTAYNRALEIDKLSLAAHLGRGNLYLQRKEIFAAVADFESAVDVDRRSFDAQFGLGRARFQQGNYKKAIDHFKNARSINEENPLTHQYLMLAYLARDDYKEVRKSYEKFEQVASADQINQLRNDSRYAAVVRVVDSEK